MGSKRGFTLIELIILIVIIGILAALAIPRFARASAILEAQQGLWSIQQAEALYMTEHGKCTGDVQKLAETLPFDVRLQEIATRLDKGLPQDYNIVYTMLASDSLGFRAMATSVNFTDTLVVGADGVIRQK